MPTSAQNSNFIRADADQNPEFIEGSNWKRLDFPDPFGYGEKYRPVFPLRHHTLKAVLDNMPETVECVYVYGSSVRLDTAFNSDVEEHIRCIDEWMTGV